MIKAWLVTHEDGGTFLTHDGNELRHEGSANTVIDRGYFMTKADLQKMWDAALSRNEDLMCGGWYPTYFSLDNYLETVLEGNDFKGDGE